MQIIRTLSDVVEWLEQWERDRAAGIVPANESDHRRVVIDLLRAFSDEETARVRVAVLAEREACAKVADDEPEAFSDAGGTIAMAWAMSAAIRARTVISVDPNVIVNGTDVTVTYRVG